MTSLPACCCGQRRQPLSGSPIALTFGAITDKQSYRLPNGRAAQDLHPPSPQLIFYLLSPIAASRVFFCPVGKDSLCLRMGDILTAPIFW